MDKNFTPIAVAYLALGSNLGDRRAAIDAACAALDAHEAIEVVARATPIETAPMYLEEQPTFLNICVCVHTTLTPHELLDACLAIEAQLGRIRRVDKGPRTIDIDIVLFGDVMLEDARLTIPHPGLLERAFVLDPLLEIAPLLRYPPTGRLLSEERHRADHDRPDDAVEHKRDVPQQ